MPPHLAPESTDGASGKHLGYHDTVESGVRYTLRGLFGQVLREYFELGGSWSWVRDHVWGGGELLATVEPTGTKHLHRDHLGSVRLETSSAGAVIATHSYWPFGEEMTVTSSSERYRFAGHERDQRSGYDFMHARYYASMAGRFFSVDPGRDYDFSHPQSSNLYAYVRNNPLSRIDPEGRKVVLANVATEHAVDLLHELEEITGLDLEWEDGVLTVVGDPSKAVGGRAIARKDLLAAINAEEAISVRGGPLGGKLADVPGEARPGTILPIIRMDFERISLIQYEKIPRLTFGPGMIFLHELRHAFFGTRDPRRDETDRQGPTVRRMNLVRMELGLPLRAQYEAERRKLGSRERYFIPFETAQGKRAGRAWLPLP